MSADNLNQLVKMAARPMNDPCMAGLLAVRVSLVRPVYSFDMHDHQP